MKDKQQNPSDGAIDDDLRNSLELLVERDNPMGDAAKTTLNIYG